MYAFLRIGPALLALAVVPLVGCSGGAVTKAVSKEPEPAAPAQPFDLRVEPAPLEVLSGGKAKVTIRATRKDYQGPIAVELRNLPEGVAAPAATIPEGQDVVEVELAASDKTVLGGRVDVLAQGTATDDADKRQGTSARFAVRVVGPFDVRVEPTALKVAPGGKARVKVTAIRRAYQGPIEVAWRDVPASWTVSPVTVPAGQVTAEADVTASKEAAAGTDVRLQAAGTATAEDNLPVSLAGLTVSVRQPFELHVQPASVKLEQTAQTRLRVTVERHLYQGPLDVELQGLPDRVSAPKRTLAAGETATEIDLAVAADAAAGTQAELTAVATALNTTDPPTPPARAVVRLAVVQAPPFTLRVEPASLELVQGGKGKVRVTATRKLYQGAIGVELRDLPAGVEAHRAVIPTGQTSVEVEVTAGESVALGGRNDLVALGTTDAATGKSEVSPAFRLSVKAPPPPFDVRVSLNSVRIAQGGTAKWSVSVVRHGYEGPIDVELRNLPAGVQGTAVLIPRGKAAVDVHLTAAANAAVGSKTDVVVLAKALDVNRQVTSSKFTVNVTKGATTK